MEHQFETIERCPVCLGKELEQEFACIDHTYSGQAFQIARCTKCGFHFTSPRPTENTIGPFYDSPEYVSHTDTEQGLLFKLYALVKRFTLVQKRHLLEHATDGRTVLDYGAGSGDFSSTLQQHGWRVTAFEPDQNARVRIQKKNSAIKVIDHLTDIPDASLDAICLWHVLEHVHKLDETIEHFHRILKPSGTLIIAVPNHTSHDAQHYGQNWAAYDVPRHLYHFNPDTITPLLTRHQFKRVEMYPMWFDAFYVSLLSEQQRNPKGIAIPISWIRAFLIGLISNFRALRSTEKCSSVIYLFQQSK